MKSYTELFTSQKQVVRELELSNGCVGHTKLSCQEQWRGEEGLTGD